jgi:hypothetical protein
LTSLTLGWWPIMRPHSWTCSGCQSSLLARVRSFGRASFNMAWLAIADAAVPTASASYTVWSADDICLPVSPLAGSRVPWTPLPTASTSPRGIHVQHVGCG